MITTFVADNSIYLSEASNYQKFTTSARIAYDKATYRSALSVIHTTTTWIEVKLS